MAKSGNKRALMKILSSIFFDCACDSAFAKIAERFSKLLMERGIKASYIEIVINLVLVVEGNFVLF